MKNPGLFVVGKKAPEGDPAELAVHRRRTVALLRKYFHMSMDMGRVPSVMGGGTFRGRATSYKMHTMEDVVIFVHDMERCLEVLDRSALELIALVVLMEYQMEEAAQLLGITIRHAWRVFPEVMDALTEELISRGLLKGDETPPKKPSRGVTIGSLQASIAMTVVSR